MTRPFFRRNRLLLALALAALTAGTAGLLLGGQIMQSRAELRDLRETDAVATDLLRATILQAGEEALMMALLGANGTHEKIDEILQRRASAEAAWQVAIDRSRSIRISGTAPPLIIRAREQAQLAHARLGLMRERAERAVQAGAAEVSRAQWLMAGTEYREAVGALRSEILRVRPLPTENGWHALAGDAAWRLGQQIGIIDGIVTFHLIHQRALDADSIDRIVNARRHMHLTLDALSELRGRSDLADWLRESIAGVEHTLGFEFDQLIRTIRDDGVSARYAFDLPSWRQVIGSRTDAIAAFALSPSASEQSRLTALIRQRSPFLAGLILTALLSGFLATAALRRIRDDGDVLFLQKELAETTLNSIGGAVLTTEDAGRIRYMNPAAEAITGWTIAEARARPVQQVFRVESGREAIIADPAGRCLRHGEIVHLNDGTLIRRNGKRIDIRNSAAPIHSRNGALAGCIVTFHDVRSPRSGDHLLSWHFTHDTLTGALNRREFSRQLQELASEAQTWGTRHTLACIDLDQFMVINDTCGHEGGDRLLRQVTQLLREGIRRNDLLARIGGNEFAIVLRSCPFERGVVLLERLREKLNRLQFECAGKTFSVSASIGAVPVTASGPGGVELLSDAGAACRVAKEKGRNRLQIWESNDRAMSRHRDEISWLPALHDALQGNGFELHAQRLLPLRTGLPERLEILLRMHDADGGLIAPARFIAAAERYGLMYRVDQWVIGNVFARLSGFLAEHRDVIVNINLSGLSIGETSIAGFIAGAARNSGVDPRQICFEVTETAAITSMDAALDAMQQIAGHGFSFALDDFGTGLASFAYLKTLPVQQIKIGDSYVRNLLTDPLSHSIVRSVIEIGNVLGVSVCAENVETEETLRMMRWMGAGYAQGYAVQRPAALEETLRLMKPAAAVT